MKILNLLFFFICFALFPVISSADKVSLSTYYPAPFGAYDRLKLVPRDSLSLENHCNAPKDVGTMYFDNGLGKFKSGVYVCQMKSGTEFLWTYLGSPAVSEKGPMTKGKIVCLKDDGNLGSCASSPSFDGTCACL